MNCSGRGIIDAEGQCQCFDAWASSGDFRVVSGDCDVTTVGLRVCFAIGLVLFIVALGHSLQDINKKLTRGSSNGNAGNRQGKGRSVLFIQGLIALDCVTFIILTVLKLTDPGNRAIGTDLFTTWVYTVGAILLFVTAATVFSMFLYISVKQEKIKGNTHFARLLWYTKWLSIALCAAMCCVQCLPLAAAYVRGPDAEQPLSRQIIKGFWIAQGSVVLAIGIVVPLSMSALCKDMENLVKRHASTSAESVAQVLKKLKSARRSVFIRSVINATITLAMGFSTDFSYWSPYLIAFQCFLVPVAILMASILVAERSQVRRSSFSSKIDSKKDKYPQQQGVVNAAGSKNSSKD